MGCQIYTSVTYDHLLFPCPHLPVHHLNIHDLTSSCFWSPEEICTLRPADRGISLVYFLLYGQWGATFHGIVIIRTFFFCIARDKRKTSNDATVTAQLIWSSCLSQILKCSTKLDIVRYPGLHKRPHTAQLNGSFKPCSRVTQHEWKPKTLQINCYINTNYHKKEE